MPSGTAMAVESTKAMPPMANEMPMVFWNSVRTGTLNFQESPKLPVMKSPSQVTYPMGTGWSRPYWALSWAIHSSKDLAPGA